MELRAARIIGLTALVGLLALGCGQTKAETADVSINSAVCELCANRIQTAVSEMDGVKGINVDIENHRAQVTFYSGKTNLVAIETVISGLGYGANDRPADVAAFTKLPACCQAGGEPAKAKMEM